MGDRSDTKKKTFLIATKKTTETKGANEGRKTGVLEDGSELRKTQYFLQGGVRFSLDLSFNG